MGVPFGRRRLFWCAGSVLLGVCGCGTAGLNGFLMELGQPRITEDEIEAQRTRFIQDRDPQALRWLLAHTLDNGMPLSEVAQALGEPGEYIYDDQHIKANDNKVHQTDMVYKWGPTTDGKSVVLFFRDGRLVHFDRHEFQKMELSDDR